MKITLDSIIPLRKNMIVRRLKQETGGILELPTKTDQRAELVEVVKKGEGCDEFEIGDILIKASYAGSGLDFFSLGKEWDDYRMIVPEHVKAKIKVD